MVSASPAVAGGDGEAGRAESSPTAETAAAPSELVVPSEAAAALAEPPVPEAAGAGGGSAGEGSSTDAQS